MGNMQWRKRAAWQNAYLSLRLCMLHCADAWGPTCHGKTSAGFCG